VRALQAPDASIRNAAAYSDSTAVTVKLSFANAYSGNVSLYALDWDNQGRSEWLSLDDGSGPRIASLTGFSQGEWVTYPVTVAAGGTVTITATKLAGPSAVLSGVMIGDAGAPPKPPTTPPGGGGALSTPPKGPQPAPTAALKLRTILGHVGYAGIVVSGKSGMRVQVSEQLGHKTSPIRLVQLTAGSASLPRAVMWRCDRRQRQIVARTLSPAQQQQATATVLTPSCSRRLVTTIVSHARVGKTIGIKLRDRWGLGALRVGICLTAPGGRTVCRPWSLHSGQAQRTVRLAVSRPGHWKVTVSTQFNDKAKALVWVF
jgi:hypothetical protein